MGPSAGEAYRIERLSSRPELGAEVDALIRAVWPRFLAADDSSVRFWRALGEELPDFQIVVTDPAGKPCACGHTIPVWWDGRIEGLPTGWDGALAQGVLRARSGAAVNTLSALAVSVHDDVRGRGLASRVIDEMKRIAGSHRLAALIAPVRPTRKAEHPHMPMERYLDWRRDDGQRYDPWIRLHERRGARVLAVAPRSMVVDAPLADWERWTGIRFAAGARQVCVPGALVPVRVDGQRAVYEEPNVWMAHPVGAPAGPAAPA